MRRNFRTVPFALLVAAAFMVGSPLAASTTPLSLGIATAEPQAKKPKGKPATIDAKARKREEVLKWLKIYLRDAGEEFDSYDPIEHILWTNISDRKVGRYLDSIKNFNYGIEAQYIETAKEENRIYYRFFPSIEFLNGKYIMKGPNLIKQDNGIAFTFLNSPSKLYLLVDLDQIENQKSDAKKYFNNNWIEISSNPGKRFLAALKDLVDLECSDSVKKSPYE